MFMLFITIFLIIGVALILKCQSKEVQTIINVVVLGDVGRSPRMQYHSLSLQKEGAFINLIGFAGSTPHTDLLSNSGIQIWNLLPLPSVLNHCPRLILYFVKVVWQTIVLMVTLIRATPCDYVLLQNPPCIPALFVCWIFCLLSKSKLVVDWHNYGYTILQLSTGNKSLLLKFARWYEHYFGKMSDHNICVTKAMREDLKLNWNINAKEMYDKPHERFCEATLEEKHKLLLKLSREYPFLMQSADTNDECEKTIFTKRESSNSVLESPNRPALLVSSTSWTDDEDFSILLAALDLYDEKRNTVDSLPDILCIITGKGPLKNYYCEKISEKNWAHVNVITPWLDAEDYPTLLGSADLGISLHFSSSGLDLPMKVVDMFGCCLPVCAIAFKCIGELVKHNENGKIFNSHQELCSQMEDMLTNFKNNLQLVEFRENLQKFRHENWNNEWERNVKPIFFPES